MLLLLGKTAAGKDSVKKELVNLGMKPIVTYTTRPMRDGEIDGVTYNFVTNEEFSRLDFEGFFLETTSYTVANGDVWYYGTPLNQLDNDRVIIVNPDGLAAIKKLQSVCPVAVEILADEDVIWNRLRERGDDAPEARRRINADDEDFRDVDKYIDLAIRNEHTTPEKLAKIIKAYYEERVTEL